jgi:hypothetical protein
MASQKLSALTAVTSTAADSLVYVADTTDSGSSFSGRKITKANLFSGYATESYVGTAISNLIDGAPGALDTLNELAAALGDDADVAASLTTLINANETHVDNMATLTGVAKDATSLGAFSGSTISDTATLKAALQSLETSLETKGSGASVTLVSGVANDVVSAVGVAQNATNLGTFTGSTIADSQTVKQALQALETAVEAAGIVDAGDNVNRLVGNTSADSVPSGYYFLVCDSTSGAIKAIDKSFMEID